MSAEFFIDTNVFVYQLERLEVRKAEVANELIEQGIATRTACISFQVIQECVNTAIRKAEIRLTEEEMRRYLEDVLEPLYRVQPSVRLYRQALDIHHRYRIGFYDSLIVAAAMEAGCSVLYSEDLQHGQSLGGVTVVDPFVT